MYGQLAQEIESTILKMLKAKGTVLSNSIIAENLMASQRLGVNQHSLLNPLKN